MDVAESAAPAIIAGPPMPIDASSVFSRAVRPLPAWRRSIASGRAASSVSARRRTNSA
jgi:hypothetical protein